MRKVLIVDDAEAERAAFEDAFSGDYSVLAAGEARDAIRIMTDEQVDAVVLGMDFQRGGYLVLGRLLGMYIKPVVVVMTEGNQLKNAVKAMRLGAADCLVRPCEPHGVKAVLDRILGQKPALASV